MMNKRFLTVLGFALVVSLGATVFLYRLVASRIAQREETATQTVVTATRNLPIGTLLQDKDLRSADWPGTVPARAVLRPADAVGRGVVETIYEGEPVLDTRLAAKGAGAGLAATIPPGMRAVAVRVNEVVGVSGFVVPGMRVDVLVSGSPPNEANRTGTQTRTILQNIEVLSAGPNMEKDAEGKPVQVTVVNLMVTPEQAEILSLASNETRIQLVLRNPLDTKESPTPGTALVKLFSGGRVEANPVRVGRVARPPSPRASRPPAAVAPEPAPKAPVIVEVIHGSKREQASFGQRRED